MTQREQQILDWITEDPMISQGGPGRAGGDYPLFGGGTYLQPDEEGPHCGPGVTSCPPAATWWWPAR